LIIPIIDRRWRVFDAHRDHAHPTATRDSVGMDTQRLLISMSSMRANPASTLKEAFT